MGRLRFTLSWELQKSSLYKVYVTYGRTLRPFDMGIRARLRSVRGAIRERSPKLIIILIIVVVVAVVLVLVFI
jgi:hypothetical protein